MKKLLPGAMMLTLIMLPSLAFAAVVATDVVCVGCVGTTDMASLGVTTAILGNNSVTTGKIVDGTILNADINTAAAITPNKIFGIAWTRNNDGSGSTLDADLIDGLNSSQFLRNDTSGSVSGVITASNFWAGSPADSGQLLWLDGGSSDGVGRITSNSADASMDLTASQGGSGNKNAALHFAVNGSWAGYIGVNGSDSDKIQIGYNTTTPGTNVALTADQTGNVGIGTTSPQKKLHVVGDSRTDGELAVTNGDTSLSFLNFGSTSTNYLRGVSTEVDTPAYFMSGNVGIGTSSPSEKLNVSGNILATGTICGSAGCVGDSSSSSTDASTLDGIDSSQFLRNDSSGSINGDLTVSNALKSAGALVFDTNGSSTSTERMRITSDGNVGIGDTSPSNKLVVSETGGDWAIKATSSASGSSGAIRATDSYTGTNNSVGVWGEAYAEGSSTGSTVGVRGDAYAVTNSGGAAFGVLGYTHVTTTDGTSSRPAGIYGGAYGPYGGGGTSGPPAVFPSTLEIDGVQGETFASMAGSAGVMGTAHSTSTKVYGVAGTTASESGGGAGVFGLHHVSGSTAEGKGVFGQTDTSATDPNSYGVYSSGTLGASGTKPAIVYTDIQGPTQLYAEEAADVWFADYGIGKLTNGYTKIQIDPLFLETVVIDDTHPLLVFTQTNGDAQIYVKKSQNSFEVIQDGGTDKNAEFSYRILAKRKYYADRRLLPTKVTIDQFMRPDLTIDQRNTLNDKWQLPRMIN